MIKNIKRLKKRGDFLRLRNGQSAGRARLVLQGAPNSTGEMRVGFTCSKRVGNAVKRNRAKRRLRAVAADVLARKGQPGWDYVFIGRRDHTGKSSFAALMRDAEIALAKVHGTNQKTPKHPKGSARRAQKDGEKHKNG